jgi:hypothetical protein
LSLGYAVSSGFINCRLVVRVTECSIEKRRKQLGDLPPSRLAYFHWFQVLEITSAYSRGIELCLSLGCAFPDGFSFPYLLRSLTSHRLQYTYELCESICQLCGRSYAFWHSRSPAVYIAVFAHGLHIVGLSTFLHKTSFSRRPSKARQNIYRASIANNNTNLDVNRLTPRG